MRALRVALVSAALVVGLAAPAWGQTTTTVRPIPVTGTGPTTTAAPTTTVRATTSTPTTVAGTAASPLASTGVAADRLVPFGFALIAMGALLTGAARRPRRTAYTFL
ncbi:MAG: hypothetical protein QOF60_2939 [Actinomycetota bacterium]|nr:hypothetical protein [Actinomycetota bacterium]